LPRGNMSPPPGGGVSSVKRQATSSRRQATSCDKKTETRRKSHDSFTQDCSGRPLQYSKMETVLYRTSSTRALRDPGGKCIVKMSRGDVTWSCQDYGQYLSNRKEQAMARKSNKRQATLIKKLHEAWAYDNGYQSQAPRHKLRQNVARYNATDYKVSSVKQQAS